MSNAHAWSRISNLIFFLRNTVRSVLKHIVSRYVNDIIVLWHFVELPNVVISVQTDPKSWRYDAYKSTAE